ncbi:hypothetical protein F2Q68_00004043 [Brassica cretica]|uniref:Transmembrane protein n=2 Tax=Brassica cretica TaxID=69181 RepID=A0ABQ7BSG1_BRACR|nr:hypothetical protein F2Q68_00004043 [Brassica cretica]KAF3542495.1 hypothetical protein DY000_02005944 [Brassica cretica]
MIDLCDSCCCFAAPSSVISLPAEDYKLAGGSSRDWILCGGAGVAVCLCTVLSFGASVFYVLLCLLVEGWCGAVLVLGKVIVSGFLRRVGFSDTSGARLEIEDLLTVQCSRWERCRLFVSRRSNIRYLPAWLSSLSSLLSTGEGVHWDIQLWLFPSVRGVCLWCKGPYREGFILELPSFRCYGPVPALL